MPWAFDMQHLADRNQPSMMESGSFIDARVTLRILQKVDEEKSTRH